MNHPTLSEKALSPSTDLTTFFAAGGALLAAMVGLRVDVKAWASALAF
jgi:hypothetical protein